MTPWIYILLSSGCSVLVAHFLRIIEYKRLNTLRVLSVNYLIATFIAFFTSGDTSTVQISENFWPVFILASVVGIIFITNFFIYSKSVHHNGVGISVASMRISLIIPVVVSTVWYQEFLQAREWLGVSLVFLTLFLLLPDKKSLLIKPYNAAWLLIFLFIFTGIGDASLKVFEADFSNIINKELFLGFVFLMATVVGLLVLCIQRSWEYTRAEVGLGIAIGIPNLYSAIFLIDALSLMSGGIVYTAANLFTVIGATLLGIYRWGDLLTRPQWIGIGLTVISILLLI